MSTTRCSGGWRRRRRGRADAGAWPARNASRGGQLQDLASTGAAPAETLGTQGIEHERAAADGGFVGAGIAIGAGGGECLPRSGRRVEPASANPCIGGADRRRRGAAIRRIASKPESGDWQSTDAPATTGVGADMGAIVESRSARDADRSRAGARARVARPRAAVRRGIMEQ